MIVLADQSNYGRDYAMHQHAEFCLSRRERTPALNLSPQSERLDSFLSSYAYRIILFTTSSHSSQTYVCRFHFQSTNTPCCHMSYSHYKNAIRDIQLSHTQRSLTIIPVSNSTHIDGHCNRACGDRYAS